MLIEVEVSEGSFEEALKFAEEHLENGFKNFLVEFRFP